MPIPTIEYVLPAELKATEAIPKPLIPPVNGMHFRFDLSLRNEGSEGYRGVVIIEVFCAGHMPITSVDRVYLGPGISGSYAVEAPFEADKLRVTAARIES